MGFTEHEQITPPPFLATLVENNEPGKPCEDAQPRCFSINSQIFIIIADGVTRSRAPDGSYPNLSPARMAADIAAMRAQRSIYDQALGGAEIDREALAHAVEEANEAVGRFSQQEGITPKSTDYMFHDLPATSITIAAFSPRERILRYAAVADSPVWVLNEEDHVMLTSMQCNNKDKEKKRRKEMAQAAGVKFDNEWWRAFYRKNYRNRKDATGKIDDTELPMGYGALTGEDGAMDFLQLDRVIVPKHCWIMAGSDGFAVLEPNQMGARAHQYHERPEMILSILASDVAETMRAKGKPHDDLSAVIIPV